MKCVVCGAPAAVWCHNDEASLCLSCDGTVHSSGPLAWKHNRTPINAQGHAQHVNDPQKPPDDSLSTRALPDQQVSAATDQLASDNPAEVTHILKEIEMGGGVSPDIGEVVDTLTAGSTDLLNMSCMLNFDQMMDELSDEYERARAPPSQAFVEPKTGALASTDVDNVDPSSKVDSVPEAESASDNQTKGPAHSSSGIGASVGMSQTLQSPPTATLPPQQLATNPPPIAPQGAPAAIFVPPTCYIGTVLPPPLAACYSYIPASLVPHPEASRAAARRDRRSRRERFKEKKARRVATSGKIVRYVSRKVYADTRPRVNGRFVRKSETESAEAAF